MKGEEQGTVGGTLRERGQECRVPTVSLEMELERIREKNASLPDSVNE